jgi:hypothetical protein
MNAITKTEARSVGFTMQPSNMDEAFRLADMLADSELVPKDFRGKPGNVMVAMQWGMEIGLKPMQSLQNIAVINGRPCLWGDAVIALVRGSSVCEYVSETDDGKAATCVVKRRGEAEQVRTFSMDDAKTAGLLGKQGPWTQYPKRMRQMRARAFALRDVFPDVLKGIQIAEEVMDYPAPPQSVHGTPEVLAATETPPDLLADAEKHAALGVAAYSKFWTEIGKENRKLINTATHESFKAKAKAADAARTVEAAAVEAQPAEDAPESSGDPWLAALDGKAPAAAEGVQA